MELIDRFNTASWVSSDLGKHKGFVTYSLVRPQMVKPGQFKYAIREVREDEADCKMDMVTLEGGSGKIDPLGSIRNCELNVVNSKVVGVHIEGECVVRKDIIS